MQLEIASSSVLFNSRKRLEVNQAPTFITPPNTSHQNFEIAILFSVIERFSDDVFEDNNPAPHDPQGKGNKLYAAGT